MSAEAAVAIVHTRAPDESVLLMRRTERENDPWSGHWSFPGGGRDPGDGDLLDTALRELFEECGIRLLREHLERALPRTLARRRTGPFLPVAPFVFQVDRELDVAANPAEAVEARWVPLRVLLDFSQHCLRPAPGVPSEMRYPSIPLNGVPLWGFTYRLIAEWLGIAAGRDPASRVALRVLEFLLTRGLELQRDWTGRVAEVRGPIPIEDVVAHFCIPGPGATSINLFEVRPEYVRIVGLDFEEYTIRAV